MWMASKMEEIEPPSVDDFVYISDNSYTKEQITNMEMTVCSSLKFRLCYTTPYMFMDEQLRASGKVTDMVRHLCLYLLELSLLPLELTSVKPSLVCGAAVYLCRVTLGMTDVNQAAFGSPNGTWTKTLEYYTGYGTFDLEDVVKVLHNYHMSSEESSLTSVFTKYKTAKYSYVALKTIPMEFGF
jgi:G2/mitotic-specific cyclin-B, other